MVHHGAIMVHHGAIMVHSWCNHGASWCIMVPFMVHHGAFHGAFHGACQVYSRKNNLWGFGVFPQSPTNPWDKTKALTGCVGLGWLALCSPMVWQGVPRAVAGH